MQLSPIVAPAAALTFFAGLGLTSRGPTPDWPPATSNIVNLDGEITPDRKKLHVIFEVPADHALVITDASVINALHSTWDGPNLVEKRGKKIRIKRASAHGFHQHGEQLSPLMFRSQTGLVFAPGSEVVLLFESHSGCWSYNVIGYLSKL